MKTLQTCPVCAEGHLHAQTTVTACVIGSVSVDLERQSHGCDICGTEFALPQDARFNARAFRCAEQKLNGKLTGDEIRALRKDLSVTQEVAGKLFGGGPVAFCKYERHDLAPSEPMDNLLWIVREFPSLAKHLGRRHGIEIVAEAAGTIEENFRFDASPLNSKQGRELFATVSSAISHSHRSWSHGVLSRGIQQEASNQNYITLKECAY